MLSYRSRIEGINVWTNVVFVLNGLIFMLIGLHLPFITSQLEISVGRAVWYGIAIAVMLIFTRFICTFGASIFTRFMSRFITVADPNPGWKAPLISGWAGMRGVVSLAAALSVPSFINGSEPFPHRNLILFITFIVILVTLVIQGLTLPWLIRKVNMEDRFTPIPEYRQEAIIQKKIAQVSLNYLQEKYSGEVMKNERLNNLIERLQIDVNSFQQDFEAMTSTTDNSLSSYQRMYLELLEQQRKLLHAMNHRTEFDEELIRKYLSLIDLEEFKIREKLVQEATE